MLAYSANHVECDTALLTERCRSCSDWQKGVTQGPVGPAAQAQASAAHLRDWWFDSAEGDVLSVGVLTQGEYDVEGGLCVALPCVAKNGVFTVQRDLLDEEVEPLFRKALKEITRLTEPARKLYEQIKANPSGGAGGFNQYGNFLADGEWVEDVEPDSDEDASDSDDMEVDQKRVVTFRLINNDGVLRGKWGGHTLRGRVEGLEVTMTMGVGGVEAVGTLEDREEAGVVLEWDEPADGQLESTDGKGNILRFGHEAPWKKLALTAAQKSFLDSQGTFRATKI